SGGRQLVFARPDGGVGNRAGIEAGVDVRGDGGYIVVPPSLHACGDRYRWTNPTAPAPPPDWLIDKIRPPTRQPVNREQVAAASASASVGDRYGRAALAGELLNLARAPEGTRNHTLNRAAFRLGQLVGAGLLHDDVVRRQLTKVAQHVGLGARETTRTVTSGMTAGINQPRPVKPRAASRA
ncbi:MAG: bifunctional DNA primase/polymerase, partial [Euzebya sp.]